MTTTPPELNTLGTFLATVLRDIPMSQSELATRTGLSPGTINRIIKGTTGISADTGIKLERALGIRCHRWLMLHMNDRFQRLLKEMA